MRRLFPLLAPLAALIFAGTALASGIDSLNVKEAGAGIREALNKGAEYAVASLGQDNGFLGNDKVRIGLPDSLRKVEKGLRALGKGKQADELVDTMNHAAEQAVAGAKPILLDAVRKMSVSDAKAILTGGDDGVTDYFRRSSSEALGKKFLPIVKAATKKVKLGEQYTRFASKAADLGLIDKKDADLDGYVTQKAMDGLFTMIAEKEKEFRRNPMEAGSTLLKKVFGAL